MSESPLGLQEFFFEAALATYAGASPKLSFSELPGSKVYRYERSPYLYIDTYFTNDERSGGQTVIYYKSHIIVNPKKEGFVVEQVPNYIPAWIMQYHGWCEGDNKETLDFLKRALSQAYRSKVFAGGRGTYLRQSHLNSALQYSNHHEGTFDKFTGEEKIISDVLPPGRINREEKKVFWHRYQGMTLLR